MEKDPILLVNFGGPRNLAEVYPFLKALLLDHDVIRPSLPFFIHRWLFTRIAKKRSVKIAEDYAQIGGKSPIFEDTEALAALLRKSLGRKVLTFHRYLPMTHEKSFSEIEKTPANHFITISLFPQFSYTTTGSIARILSEKLSLQVSSKIKWISSYAQSQRYLLAMKQAIDDFLKEKDLQQDKIVLLFSAHGLPEEYVHLGDPYKKECEASFEALKAFYPNTLCKLSYQSKFGPGEWIKPYTEDVCEQVEDFATGLDAVCIVPLSFTSDHIETLYEIEELYVRKIIEKGFKAYRVPALGLRNDWVDAFGKIIEEADNFTLSQELIRRKSKA